MKRCSNPNCDSNFMFGNDKTECPFCHNILVENVISEESLRGEVIDCEIDERDEIPFIQRQSSNIKCYGRITEINHHEIFNGKWNKLFNAVIRDEPYQFAYQTIEYTIRVKNISSEVPVKITDFCMYGNYLGRLQVGDEVFINAKEYSDRRVVKKIYNQTTSSVVRPGFQIPAGIIRGLIMLPLIAIILCILAVIWFIKSSTLASALSIIMTFFLPSVIFIIGIATMILSVFCKHKHRHRKFFY